MREKERWLWKRIDGVNSTRYRVELWRSGLNPDCSSLLTNGRNTDREDEERSVPFPAKDARDSDWVEGWTR